MNFIHHLIDQFVFQLQSPSLAFLIAGVLIAALGSKLEIPKQIYQFVVFMLLMKVGLMGGVEIRDANVGEMVIPAFLAVLMGLLIVVLGNLFFSFLPVKKEDGIATAGLFGAVSASTFAAAMILLDEERIAYEAWVPALYPFMDIPALILAIVFANVYIKQENKQTVWQIIKESLRGPALSAMLLGIFIGILARPDAVLHSFYKPLFAGFLSVLMLIMGMEAYQKLHELRKVAHCYIIYGLFAPIVHGLIAFGLGWIAHMTVGFSPGGVVLFSVIAASSSDISGPPTLRGGIPSANPSAYVGTSTSIGTPVAVAICIPLFIALSKVVFG